jgi:translation initiation factor 4E
MDTVSTPSQLHTLHDKWNMYYHLPDNKSWDLASYTVLMGSIDNAEAVIALASKLHDNAIRNCMLFVMRDGITPMWEDKQNRDGGCFSYKVSNKFVPEVWKNLFYCLSGESLCNKYEHNAYVNGITISPKKNFCIIKIWLSNTKLQDPGCIINIPNLLKQGCLFKKHLPEF